MKVPEPPKMDGWIGEIYKDICRQQTLKMVEFMKMFPPTPQPWYRRLWYRYWLRPWRAIRHSVCCSHEDY